MGVLGRVGTLADVFPPSLASSESWPAITATARSALVNAVLDHVDEGRVTLLGAADAALVTEIATELERALVVLDSSRSTLRRLRRELESSTDAPAIDLYAEDLREFDVAEESDCAVVPTYTLRALLTRTAQLQCLRCIAGSLPQESVVLLHVDTVPDGLPAGRLPETVLVESDTPFELADHDTDTLCAIAEEAGLSVTSRQALADDSVLLVARRS